MTVPVILLSLSGLCLASNLNFANNCDYAITMCGAGGGPTSITLEAGQTQTAPVTLGTNAAWNQCGSVQAEFYFAEPGGKDWYDLSEVAIGFNGSAVTLTGAGGTVTCDEHGCPDAFQFQEDYSKQRWATAPENLQLSFCAGGSSSSSRHGANGHLNSGSSNTYQSSNLNPDLNPPQYSNANPHQYSKPNPTHYSKPNPTQYLNPNPTQYSNPNSPQYSNPYSNQYTTPTSPQYSNPNSNQYTTPTSPQYSNPNSPQYSNPYSPQYSNPYSNQYNSPTANPNNYYGWNQYGNHRHYSGRSLFGRRYQR